MMLPSIRFPPSAGRNDSFRIYEENADIKEEKKSLTRKRRVGGVGGLDKKFGDHLDNGENSPLNHGLLATPNPGGNGGGTPLFAPAARKKEEEIDVASPAKLFARSPFQDIGSTNSPLSRLAITPKSTKGLNKRALNGFFSVGKSLKASPFSRLPPLDRSFHAYGKSSRHHDSKSRDNAFLCKSLFGATSDDARAETPVSENDLVEVAREASTVHEDVDDLVTSPSLFSVKIDPPESRLSPDKDDDCCVKADCVFPNAEQQPIIRGSKALLNNAFIESMSRVEDDTLGLDSVSSKRKSGGGIGSGGRCSGVLTSSPKCVAKCTTPTGSAACSLENGSSNSVRTTFFGMMLVSLIHLIGLLYLRFSLLSPEVLSKQLLWQRNRKWQRQFFRQWHGKWKWKRKFLW